MPYAVLKNSSTRWFIIQNVEYVRHSPSMQLIHLNFLRQKNLQIRDRKKAQEMDLSADSHQKEAQQWITDGGKKG